MNTADKSIANIDIALRRRFDFIPMFTDYSVILEFENILRPINNIIYEKKRSIDYMIGHAFFVNKAMDDIGDIVNRKLIPVLNKYFYLDSNEVKDILNRGGIKVKENVDTFQLEFDRFKEFNESKAKDFRSYINEGWRNRYNLYDDRYLYGDEDEFIKEQRFLTFYGNLVKARNYVDFIC